MSSSILGLIVGGLIPAVGFGLSGVFAKYSTKAGITSSLYLICIGVAVTVVGGGFYLFEPQPTITVRSAFFASIAGVCWAIGAGLVALALLKFDTPISKLVPLYNANTLIAVLLGLWLFAEWQEITVWKLTLGATLIIVGGVLVVRA